MPSEDVGGRSPCSGTSHTARARTSPCSALSTRRRERHSTASSTRSTTKTSATGRTSRPSPPQASKPSPRVPATATAPAADADVGHGADLVSDDVAEQRAHAALERRDAHAAECGPLSRLERLLEQLERRIGDDTRYSLHRVAPGDWSAITIDGDSGHGSTAAAAVDDLLRCI